MLISGVLELLNSVILYIVPHGRVAYWSDWHMLGLSKSQWGEQHLNLGVLFLLAAFLHAYYNWTLITTYLKNKAKEVKVFTGNFNIALVLTLLVAFGTYFMVPPLSTIINFGESIKDSASEKYGEPPYGHAELSSLKLFSKKVQIDLVKGKELLSNAGIKVKDDKQSIGDIARANAKTPKQIYEIMKPAAVKPAPGQTAAFPDSPPPGFGKKVLAEICAEYNLHIPDVLHALDKQGIKGTAEKTVKEVAADNDANPIQIFEIIQGVAQKK